MPDYENILQSAESNLNDSLRHFENAPTELAREFTELKMQACIFQYDVSAEITSLLRNNPSGFAMSVSLKGLVLRLFEYDVAMNKHIIPRILRLAETRGISIDRTNIKTQRRKWKAELSQLKSWEPVRNRAAGHYDKNIPNQVELLQSLNFDEVMTVATAFLHFNLYMLKVLKDAGLGSSKDSKSQ